MRFDIKGSILLSLVVTAFINLLFASPIWAVVLGVACYFIYREYFAKKKYRHSKRGKYVAESLPYIKGNTRVDNINDIWYS